MSLLEFSGSDEEFEDCFMLTFQISLTDNFDSVVSFNLKENGDKIPVTKQNRQVFYQFCLISTHFWFYIFDFIYKGIC